MEEKIPEVILEPKPDYSNLFAYASLLLPILLIKINPLVYGTAQFLGLIAFIKLQNREYKIEVREWENGKISSKTTIIQYSSGLKTRTIKINTSDTCTFEGVEYGSEKIVLLKALSTRNAGKILIDYDPARVKIIHNLPYLVKLEDGYLKIFTDEDVSITKTLGYIDETPVFTEEDFDELKEGASEGIILTNTVTDNKLKILPPGRVRIFLPGPALTPKNYFDFFREEFDLDTPFGLGDYKITINGEEYMVKLLYDCNEFSNDEVREPEKLSTSPRTD